MNIATILFTYNRPYHTRKVLEGLRNNTILPSKLFVFHDGMKESTDIDKWKEVEEVIREVWWCENEIISSSKNKGLADSISLGITHVLDSYEAVIVLEDDCVPHPQFMEYMIAALEKYVNCDSVYSIGASAEPINVPPNGFDAYFVGRINSCGWGTWRKKWEIFSRDYRILGRMRKNPEVSQRLDIWGQDLEGTLIDNIYGRADSWAVFWALNVIEQRGLCLSPYESYVDNIGFDGSGVHSGVCNVDWKAKPKDMITEISLPDSCVLVENYSELFADYYPWVNPLIREEHNRRVAYKLIETIDRENTISEWFARNGIENICIWGAGVLCLELLRRIGHDFNIVGIILSNSCIASFEGIDVFSPSKIPDMIDSIVVIPGYDVGRIKKSIAEGVKDKIITLDEILSKKPLKMYEKNLVESQRLKKYGSEYGGYYIYKIDTIKIVYSFGIGEDISFSEEILEEYHPCIWAFDPTPKACSYVESRAIFADSRFHFEKIGLSGENMNSKIYLPRNDQYVLGSTFIRDDLDLNSIDVEMQNLNYIASRLGHEKIDILKMDIEGSEFDVIDSIDFNTLEISQICVEIHDRFFEDGLKKIARMDSILEQNGFALVSISDNQENLTYVNRNILV